MVSVFACPGPTGMHSFALARRAGVELEKLECAVVQGLGPVGMFGLAYLKAIGIKRVYAVTSGKNEERDKIAYRLGAERVFALSRQSADEIDDILRSERFVLPQAGGAEPRALVIVETEDYVFAATHLDHVSAAAQHEQVRAIDSLVARFVAGVRKPVFLAGDMNATPDSETLRLFRQRWRLLTPTDGGTYPSDPPRECIDYIFQLDNGARCGIVQARVLDRFEAGSVQKASDHLPVVLDVRIDR